MGKDPIAAGKSSFSLLDQDLFFKKLPLVPNTVILDAACGAGNYSLAMAEHLNNQAVIYTLDLWKEGINQLSKVSSQKGLSCIRPILADLSQRFPLDTNAVHFCLMATALHDLIQVGAHAVSLKEIARILKPNGTLALIEFQKIDPPPGPPLEIRLSPEELQKQVEPYGFQEIDLSPLGPYLYLSLQRLKTGVKQPEYIPA